MQPLGRFEILRFSSLVFSFSITFLSLHLILFPFLSLFLLSLSQFSLIFFFSMTVQQHQPSSTAAGSSDATAAAASSSVNANATKRNFRPLADYRRALEQFSAERQQQRESITDASCDQPLVDEFLEFVALTGQAHLEWPLIQPMFIWKLQFYAVMDAVHVKEAEAQRDDVAKEALINDAELKDTKAFVMDKARTFDGIPFTIQRLCELLTMPDKHYHSTGTYLRALEKNINVVTTVTENGMRITGADGEEEVEKDAPIRVEQNFIVSVDEIDEPLALKVERQNQREKKGHDTTVEGEAQQSKMQPPSDDSSAPSTATAAEEGK